MLTPYFIVGGTDCAVKLGLSIFWISLMYSGECNFFLVGWPSVCRRDCLAAVCYEVPVEQHLLPPTLL